MAEPAVGLERPTWVRRDLGDATGAGVRVGLIDSGRDPRWRDSRLRPGIGLVGADEDFSFHRSDDDRDRIGHGTACADILLGMAPGVEIVPIRVFNRRLETSPEVIVEALGWALEEGLDVVNLSLGTVLERAVEPFYRICEAARRRGVIVVSALNLATGWSYPGVFENALGVQAGRFASVWDFEMHPGEAVECVAHGEREVRWLGGERRRLYGSSFAAPHLTAIVALLLECHPRAGLEGVREQLAKHAVAPAWRRDAS